MWQSSAMEVNFTVVDNVCSHTGERNAQVFGEVERVGIANAELLEQFGKVLSLDNTTGIHITFTDGHTCIEEIGILLSSVAEALVTQIFLVGDNITPVLHSHHRIECIGVVTNGVEMVIQREQVDKCVTIGPAIMMKFVALTTKKYNVPTDASLNTIMVDGTGMCGACRVTVGGVTRFVCVDGPEFDAHQVDFDEMMSRSGAYREEEQLRMEQYRKGGNA